MAGTGQTMLLIMQPVRLRCSIRGSELRAPQLAVRSHAPNLGFLNASR